MIMLKKKTKVFFTGLKILVTGLISKMWSYIKTYFLTGLIVLLPSALTIYVLFTIFTWADSGFIAAYIHKLLRYKIPGLGFIFTIGMIIFSGVVARNFIGEKLFFFVEKMLLKIPLAKNIMTAVRQLLDFMSKNKKEVFNKVVLIEYPRKECWVIGFVSTDAPDIVNNSLNQKLTSIFVPTTPNPTSGFLIFLPKNEIVEINITMEEAMKIIVSGGVLTPENEEKDFLVRSDSEGLE
jgi:uncharacterized membrane protein